MAIETSALNFMAHEVSTSCVDDVWTGTPRPAKGRPPEMKLYWGFRGVDLEREDDDEGDGEEGDSEQRAAKKKAKFDCSFICGFYGFKKLAATCDKITWWYRCFRYTFIKGGKGRKEEGAAGGADDDESDAHEMKETPTEIDFSTPLAFCAVLWARVKTPQRVFRLSVITQVAFVGLLVLVAETMPFEYEPSGLELLTLLWFCTVAVAEGSQLLLMAAQSSLLQYLRDAWNQVSTEP